jgi:broad specificity phosphatase PhoE
MKRNPHLYFLALFAVVFSDSPASAQRAIILVRHAEKETDRAKIGGLPDDQIPLSNAGETRADALAFLLKDSGLTAIYTSAALRTKRTARPVAGQQRITPRVLDKDAVDPLRDMNPNDVVLIVGHSTTVPSIIDKVMKRAVGITICEDEFDNLYVLYRQADGSWGLVRSRY